MSDQARPSQAAPGFPSKHLAWPRIFGWTVLIYVTVSLVAMAFGISMMAWQFFGETMEEAAATNRLVRQFSYSAATVLLVWRFALPLQSRRLLNVLVLFALIQGLGTAVGILAFGDSLLETLDAWSMARALVATLLGWALACWSAGRGTRARSVSPGAAAP